MEKVGKEICLDSDVLIDLLNGDKNILKEFKNYVIYITSISAFEYSLGNVSSEESFEVLSKFAVLPFTMSDGILSGILFKKLRKKAFEVEFRDVMIASICINNRITLLTRNKKHFERFKEDGLKLVEES